MFETAADWLRAIGFAYLADRLPRSRASSHVNEEYEIISQIGLEGMDQTMDAYVLLKVDPQWSGRIIKRWSDHSGVVFAAAIWGEWDIILLVQTDSMEALRKFVDDLRSTEASIKSTETLLIRTDQTSSSPTKRRLRIPLQIEHSRWNWVILMLRGSPIRPILSEIEKMNVRGTSIIHYAGLLGRYDVAITLQYENDLALSELVMAEIQGHFDSETSTMPAIRGMFCIQGEPVNGAD